MEKLTVNQSNWTGRSVTVDIDRQTGNFELFDSHFNLSFVDEETAVLTGEEWSDPLAYGCKLDQVWLFEAFGIARESFDPFKAAIQLLSNII